MSPKTFSWCLCTSLCILGLASTATAQGVNDQPYFVVAELTLRNLPLSAFNAEGIMNLRSSIGRHMRIPTRRVYILTVNNGPRIVYEISFPTKDAADAARGRLRAIPNSQSFRRDLTSYEPFAAVGRISQNNVEGLKGDHGAFVLVDVQLTGNLPLSVLRTPETARGIDELVASYLQVEVADVDVRSIRSGIFLEYRIAVSQARVAGVISQLDSLNNQQLLQDMKTLPGLEALEGVESSSLTVEEHPTNRKNKLTAGQIAGAVVGLLVVSIVAVTCLVCATKTTRRTQFPLIDEDDDFSVPFPDLNGTTLEDYNQAQEPTFTLSSEPDHLEGPRAVDSVA